MQPPSPEESAAIRAITAWRFARSAPADFPFDTVVAAFHRVGRHHVAPGVLAALAGVREVLAAAPALDEDADLLDRFLDVALAKWDDRFANPTYLGLGLLPLPTEDLHGRGDTEVAGRDYDRLLVHLIADLMRFETGVADGTIDLSPELRPEPRTTAKRCRLGLQVAGPSVRRLGWGDLLEAADPVASARRLWTRVDADLSRLDRRRLQLTMLPVSLVHDEYQFIRVLQAFEATFALMAVQLNAAIHELTAGNPELAAALISAATATLHDAAPLFSLVGTMRVEAFQTFRVFTEGASAIQSRNYKLVEALCRRPDQSRLDSAAYHSVPEVRRRVLTGHQTLDEAYLAAREGHQFVPHSTAALEQAMTAFAATLRRWRRTHYRLAERMLGERTGTGYNEGAPYLKSVQTIPVFTPLATLDETDDQPALRVQDAPGDNPPSRGRCPFSEAISHVQALRPARLG